MSAELRQKRLEGVPMLVFTRGMAAYAGYQFAVPRDKIFTIGLHRGALQEPKGGALDHSGGSHLGREKVRYSLVLVA